MITIQDIATTIVIGSRLKAAIRDGDVALTNTIFKNVFCITFLEKVSPTIGHHALMHLISVQLEKRHPRWFDVLQFKVTDIDFAVKQPRDGGTNLDISCQYGWTTMALFTKVARRIDKPKLVYNLALEEARQRVDAGYTSDQFASVCAVRKEVNKLNKVANQFQMVI